MKTYISLGKFEGIPNPDSIVEINGISMVKVANPPLTKEAIKVKERLAKNSRKAFLKQRRKIRIAPGSFGG